MLGPRAPVPSCSRRCQHRGNSHLTFVYQRVARWVLDADSTERARPRDAAAPSGEIDLPASPVAAKKKRD